MNTPHTDSGGGAPTPRATTTQPTIETKATHGI